MSGPRVGSAAAAPLGARCAAAARLVVRSAAARLVVRSAAVRCPRVRSAAGQASVEVVALLPLAALVALAVGQLLAAGTARELAGNAAEAGAAALLQGSDPAAAARDALAGWARERATVRVAGRRVEVRVRPRTVIPVLAGRLDASATADAGPP